MDVLEKKKNAELSHDVKLLVKNLQYKKYKVQMKGSASFKLLKYLSDYDFYCNIPIRDKVQTVLKQIKNIIKKMENNTQSYFLTGIVFEDDENKYRFTTPESIYMKEFEEVYQKAEFMKLDFVTYQQNKFVALDCIYYFTPKDKHPQEIVNSLEEDVEKYTKEKRFYKVLKRKFRIYEEKKDYEQIKKLITIFNSDLGEKYEVLSNLEAIKEILINPRYNTHKLIKKKIYLNLKEIGHENITSIKELEKAINKLNSSINTKAKKLNEQFII